MGIYVTFENKSSILNFSTDKLSCTKILFIKMSNDECAECKESLEVIETEDGSSVSFFICDKNSFKNMLALIMNYVILLLVVVSILFSCYIFDVMMCYFD